MNTGLAILIARTKTHPEEFTGYDHTNMIQSKWVTMIENFTRYMTDEEKAAWQEAMHDLNKWRINKRRDDFTEMVMKELAGEELNPLSYTEALAFSMKNTKQVLEAGLLKTFKAQYESEDFTNAFKVNE